MENVIVKYQRAFNMILSKLKKNKNVIAVAVFGSIVTGDIWDESDIDLIVVMDKQDKPIDNIYSTIGDVPIQIKFTNSEYIKNVQDSSFIEKLKSSKIMFCNDSELFRFMQGVTFNMTVNDDKEIQNLNYLGLVLKDINVIKKYLHNNGDYVAYSVAVRCAENLCRLFLNMNGYTVSKDSIKLAVNINDNIKYCIDRLFFDKSVNREENIYKFINVAQDYLEKTCSKSTLYLIKLLNKENRSMSSAEINQLEEFKEKSIKMEEILDFMCRNNILYKELRDYRDSDGSCILKQNVYHT